jgi:hypothetical protein
MKITRQRLKDIIMEEIALQEASPDLTQMTTAPGEGTGQTAYVGNAPANAKGMDEITEGEGMELLSQAAQVLIDAGIVGAESPEELMMALKGLGKAAIAPLAAAAMGGAAMAGKDAIEKIMSKDDSESTETALEEAEENTLEELITQAIQEELGRL